jgi:CHASE1-domain containing sensor protein
MAADLLAQVSAEIDDRLAALRPAVEEDQHLLGAARSL